MVGKERGAPAEWAGVLARRRNIANVGPVSGSERLPYLHDIRATKEGLTSMASIVGKALVSLATGAVFLTAPAISASAAVAAAPVATASDHDNGTITTPGKPTAGKWEWFKCAWGHLGDGHTPEDYHFWVSVTCGHHLDD